MQTYHLDGDRRKRVVLRESVRGILFALVFGLHSANAIKAAAQEAPQTREVPETPADQRTLMHMEILTVLSEIHRQMAAEVAALGQQRTALTNEIAGLTAQREAEIAALKELRQQRTAEEERLRAIRQAIASELERIPPAAREPFLGAPSAPQGPRQQMQSAPKRVFIHYSPNDQRGRALAERVAERLTQHGFSVPEIRPVGVRLSSPSIRYFFPDDKSATDAIGDIVATSLRDAGATSLPARVQDFTRSSSKPIRGTLEVWIPAG
jgi:hypothetical protein